MRTVILFTVLLLFGKASSYAWTAEEETPEYWLQYGRQELEQAKTLEQINTNVARNVIIFLGDGMSIPTITAGRILKGQMQGHSGEETILAMEQFPHVGLSKTYAVDKQVADSASTATAYLCGVKSNYYTLGLSAKARIRNCTSSKGNEVNSILVDAFKAGKSTGVVTTTRINHATPGGSYAHTPYRGWYDDTYLTEEAKENGCKDIAHQFYDNSHMITVALGGGRKYFQPDTTTDPEYTAQYNNRGDGQNLIEQWLEANQENGWNAKYVWNQTDFDNVDPATTDKLLGLFEPADMNYEAMRNRDSAGEPSLAEMTEKAIRMLQKNSKGFFLLVEGGRIDHGHHSGDAYLALHDLVAFDNAIAKGVEMTSEGDTLIIVTADHSHTLNFGGYTDRGNDIFGLAVTGGEVNKGTDGKPFTSLLYGNGPGFQGPTTSLTDPHSRQDLTDVDTGSATYLQQTAVPLASETHGGDDVAIFARGPMSHLIHGVHQQSYIAYVMRYASCLGSDTEHCDEESVITPGVPISSSVDFLGIALDSTAIEVALNVQFALLICLALFSLFMCFLAFRNKRRRSQKGILENDYQTAQM